MAARKPTLFQQAQKEIRRIKKAASRISKRGYEFDIPFLKPKKRYTRKDVEKLQSIKSKDLYKYASAYGMTGERYREIERSRAAQKAVETKRGLNKPFEFDARKAKKEFEEFKSVSKTIIDNFLQRRNFVKLSDAYYEKVVNFIQSEISRTSEGNVANAIQKAALTGAVREIHLAYDWNFYIKMADFIPYFNTEYDEQDVIDFSEEPEEDINGFEMLPESDSFEDIFGK